MPTGPAACQNDAHLVTINHVLEQRNLPVDFFVCFVVQVFTHEGRDLTRNKTYSVCFVTFNSTPTHAKVTNSEDPP